MRFVPKSKQHRDPDTDDFIAISYAAFRLRSEDKGGLSVTWVEHFGAKGLASKQLGAIAYRASQPSGKLGAQGVFATAQVASILQTGKEFKKGLRVVYDPIPGNSGHAEIRQFTDGDLELLDDLAASVFIEIDSVANLKLP